MYCTSLLQCVSYNYHLWIYCISLPQSILYNYLTIIQIAMTVGVDRGDSNIRNVSFSFANTLSSAISHSDYASRQFGDSWPRLSTSVRKHVCNCFSDPTSSKARHWFDPIKDFHHSRRKVNLKILSLQAGHAQHCEADIDRLCVASYTRLHKR